MKKNYLLLSLAFLTVSIMGGYVSPGFNQVKASTQLFKEDPRSDQNLIFPTKGKITSKYQKGHYAIDIANQIDTSIWAAQSGTVVKVYNDCKNDHIPTSSCGGGYGNHIIIDHGNKLQTLYAHLSTISVKIGDSLTQGQVIGTMGSSGRTHSPNDIHLHFEVRNRAMKVDPFAYLFF